MMIARFLRWGVFLALGLLLSNCYTDYGPVAADSLPLSPYNVATRIQTGDQLKVIVFGEDALSGVYEVMPSGIVRLPLVPPIMAAGRTRAEFETALTNAYASGKFIQDPKIAVSVVTYRPIYVFGEVLRPGQIPYVSGLDVLTAVTTAGGFTYRASKTSALIRHPGDEVWQEYSLATPVPIAPGDLIRIPERYF
jgi:polysaccharide export outer membrane protein